MDPAPTKRCGHCQELKPVDAFAWRNRAQGKRAPFCRSCQAEYNRKHYIANKALYKARAVDYKRRCLTERTRLLLDFFVLHPCVDCGETDPVVLEFDHLRDKQFEISAMLTYRRWEAVLAEIEKCEVVCANCHRRRTSSRCGAMRVLLSQSDQAGDENRTRTESLEGSRATITPRPRRPRS